MERNIFDLGRNAWDLFQNARKMSKEELIRKVSETIIVSATLVVWDALAPLIETQLAGVVGPLAPYLAAAISAIGFGLSSHYLQQFVPKIVDFLVSTRTGYADALDAQREACLRLIALSEQEFHMINVLGRFVESSLVLEIETKAHIRALSSHTAIEPFDVRALLKRK